MRLPESVQEIANVIGREQALLLIGKLPVAYTKDNRRPGATTAKLVMYVPTVERLRLDHPLVKVLGWHDAAKLSKAFGGEIMYPANCACVARQFRDETIMRMVNDGVKKSIIAEQVGISERQVRNVANAFGQVAAIPPEERATAANDNAPITSKGAQSAWINQTSR